MPAKALVPQIAALSVAILGLAGLMVYLGLSIHSARDDDPGRRNVAEHATAVNFLCVDGYDDRVAEQGAGGQRATLPALRAALDRPTEAAVDAALKEMALTRAAGGLQWDGPGVWMTLVAVDPGLSKRFFRAMDLPCLTPVYEAHYGEGLVPEEWDIGELSYFAENSTSKEWAIRFGHLERQLVSDDPSVYHGDNDFPFRQGSLNMTNASWDAANDTASEDLADAILELLDRPIPETDLWLLTVAPSSVIVEPTYKPSRTTPALPTLGWPVLLEVHLIFGKVHFAVVRDAAGAVQYWTGRNGSSSHDFGLATNLTDAESSFLDTYVPLALVGGEDGSNLLFHSERLAQALASPVLRADWLVFGVTDSGQTGPQLHQLRYFWDSEARSVNPAAGPRIGDEMARDLMAGFGTRRHARQNGTKITADAGTFGVDWHTGMDAIGCAQLPGQETSASYCGCPVTRPSCLDMFRARSKSRMVAEL